MDAENSVTKQRGRPFKRGQSGNPSGKPKGSRNRTTLAIEALLEGEAEALTRVCIERAKAGDSTALRLAMERICPPLRERAMLFELQSVTSAADLPVALGRVRLERFCPRKGRRFARCSERCAKPLRPP